jgi:hypothetical protein
MTPVLGAVHMRIAVAMSCLPVSGASRCYLSAVSFAIRIAPALSEFPIRERISARNVGILGAAVTRCRNASAQYLLYEEDDILRRWRMVAGILLALLAVAGLVFWETAGRSRLLMDLVVVAGADIRAGTTVRAEMLSTVLMPKDGVIDGGFPAGREDEIVGRRTAWPVSARQQISTDIFEIEDDYLKAGESFFVIPADWIAMRSSARRRGDTVEITSAGDARVGFGRYRLAFVKNTEEIEVRDMLPSGDLLSEALERRERTDANTMIDHVEIITTKAAYEVIRAFAESAGAPSLILIQREGG